MDVPEMGQSKVIPVVDEIYTQTSNESSGRATGCRSDVFT